MNLPVSSCFRTCLPYRRHGIHRVSSVPLHPLSSHLADLFDPGGRSLLLPYRPATCCLLPRPRLRLPQLRFRGSIGSVFVFRLCGLVPIRLTLALPLQVQWVTSGGWLDLAAQGFPAEMAGVYQWLSPVLDGYRQGQHSLAYSFYLSKAGCVGSSHGRFCVPCHGQKSGYNTRRYDRTRCHRKTAKRP
jgi:hypothetical protein